MEPEPEEALALAGVVRTFWQAAARRQKEAPDVMEEKVTMERIERTNEAESREDVGATPASRGDSRSDW